MYLLSGLHGHGTSASPVGERGADGVDARDELAVVAEHVEGTLAHPRHDPHAGGDIGGVAELDADVGDRRAQRTHRERDDVHRPAPHRPGVQLLELGRRISPGSRQLFVGPASASRSRADERPVLDAGDVGRDRSGPRSCSGRLPASRAVNVPAATRSAHSRAYSSARAVAPVHVVGLQDRRPARRPTCGACCCWCDRSSICLRCQIVVPVWFPTVRGEIRRRGFRPPASSCRSRTRDGATSLDPSRRGRR